MAESIRENAPLWIGSGISMKSDFLNRMKKSRPKDPAV